MKEIVWQGIAPQLTVPDIIASSQFYRDYLGFGFNRYWGEPPNFAILHRGAVQLMLSQDQENGPQPLKNGHFDVYIFA